MILYLDCIGGAAGDMVLGALIDAGTSVDAINDGLRVLGIAGLRVETARASRHSIDSATVKIRWDGDGLSDEDSAEHPGRRYVDIRTLISQAHLPARVQSRALAAFRRLAEAEGRIHGTDPEEAHFHELGSEDAIGDIVGVCIALDLLGVDEIQCSPLPIGRGFVRSEHGVLPLPAPATLELLKGLPVEGVDIDRELVTPTGAALVASLATSFGTFPSMIPQTIGYGAGGRDLPQRPNIVRAVIGQPVSSSSREVVLIETNLDDCLPEFVPDAAAAVTRAGALDVWTSSAQMKKGRPGFVLHALARRERSEDVALAMLTETSALGVRMCTYDRIELDRAFLQVKVDAHVVNVKLGKLGDRTLNYAPEHDDCAIAAAAMQVPVKEVYARALTAAFVAEHHD